MNKSEKIELLKDRVDELSDIVNILIGRIGLLESKLEESEKLNNLS